MAARTCCWEISGSQTASNSGFTHRVDVRRWVRHPKVYRKVFEHVLLQVVMVELLPHQPEGCHTSAIWLATSSTTRYASISARARPSAKK